jgi:hypothetical protein
VVVFGVRVFVRLDLSSKRLLLAPLQGGRQQQQQQQ